MHRGCKQHNQSVTNNLIDCPSVGLGCVDHAIQVGVQKAAAFLRRQAFNERSEPREVGEQKRHVAALST